MITLGGPQCIVDKSSKKVLARGRAPPPFLAFGGIWTPNPSLMYTSIAALLCKEQVNVSLPACEMQYPCFHWERRCALHPAQQRLRLSSPSVSQISQPAGWTTPLRISLFKRRLNGNKFLDSVWWPFHFPQTSLLRFILWSSEFFLAPAGVKPEEIWAFDRHTTIIKVLENSKFSESQKWWQRLLCFFVFINQGSTMGWTNSINSGGDS